MCALLPRCWLIAGLVTLAALAGPPPALARVTGFEITREAAFLDGLPFGSIGGYERIDATAHFAIDPASERGRRIVGLESAPLDGDGLVRFSSEVVILRPADPAKRQPFLYHETVNRGASLSLAALNLARGFHLPETPAAAGDGFLFQQGWTLVFNGWQTDIRDGLLGLDVPVLEGVVGPSREQFVFDALADSYKAALSYPAATLDPARARLTVRARPLDPHDRPDGLSFRFLSEREIAITRPENADAGAIYELIYPATGAKPSGLGFVATADLISFLRGRAGHDAENLLGPIRHTLSVGISQGGRYLRDFLYQGFNADAGGRRVFDGMMPIVAGARRSFTNALFAQPGRVSRQHEEHDFPGDQFPFSYAEAQDPISGSTGSLMTRCRASRTCPKLMQIDSSAELWQGRASLLTTAPDGSVLEMPRPVRLYLLAGLPHFAGWLGDSQPSRTCIFATNPVSPAPALRALTLAMAAWLTRNIAPPPSRYPSVSNGTLVDAGSLDFPFPDPASARPAPNPLHRLDARFLPPRRGPSYPILVPAIDDADGIDLGGIRLPRIAVPLGSPLGWNLRREGFAPGQLCSLTSGFVPFPESASPADPRQPLAARYADEAAYLAAIEQAAEALAEDGFLRTEDIPALIGRAALDYSALATGP